MSNFIHETVDIDGQCYSRISYPYAPKEYAVEKYRTTSGCLYWARLNPKTHKAIIAKIDKGLEA